MVFGQYVSRWGTEPYFGGGLDPLAHAWLAPPLVGARTGHTLRNTRNKPTARQMHSRVVKIHRAVSITRKYRITEQLQFGTSYSEMIIRGRMTTASIPQVSRSLTRKPIISLLSSYIR